MGIIIPYQKPDVGGVLDVGHPLVSGMVAFVPFNSGGGNLGYANLATSNPLAPVGSPVWGNGPYGLFLNCAAGGSGAALSPFPPLLQIQAPLTIACRVMWTAASGTASASTLLCWRTQATSTGNLAMIYFITSPAGQIRIQSPGTNITPISGSLVVGVWTTIALTVTPTGLQCYQNGNLIYSNTTANTARTYTSTGYFTAGWNSALAAGAQTNTAFDWIAAWSRALTPGEHADLADNPWQVIRSPIEDAILGSVSPAFRPWFIAPSSIVGIGIY